MVIKVFDPVTLKEKYTVSKITSLISNRRFYKVGSFEITTTQNVFSENDIIAYYSFGKIRSGIVMKISEKNDVIHVSGTDLKGLYGFRYITAPTSYNATPAIIMKSLVTQFLKSGDRDIPQLNIAPGDNAGDIITYTPEKGFLDKTMESFGIANEIGTSIEFDLTSFEFKTLKGVDRSNNLRFGRKLRNIKNIEYTKDIFNTYNVGYSLDEEEKETVTGTQTGILRRECFKDKNIEEYLKEKSMSETLRAEANEKYRYGIDYDLGDYVKVVHRDLETVKQITEIKEVHEKNNNFVVPVFGTEKENPLKKIMKGN